VGELHACTRCTELGKELGAKHGMPEEFTMCAACAAMVIEGIEGGMGGDY
jgi:hypothetical protein